MSYILETFTDYIYYIYGDIYLNLSIPHCPTGVAYLLGSARLVLEGSAGAAGEAGEDGRHVGQGPARLCQRLQPHARAHPRPRLAAPLTGVATHAHTIHGGRVGAVLVWVVVWMWVVQVVWAVEAHAWAGVVVCGGGVEVRRGGRGTGGTDPPRRTDWGRDPQPSS